MPVLALLGIAVSAYLGMVETNDVSAVCGPVGDCNAVQQSEYARLFGVPIGVLGVIGYALLLAGWLVARLVRGRTADLIVVGMAAGAFLGVCLLRLPHLPGAVRHRCHLHVVHHVGADDAGAPLAPGAPGLGRLGPRARPRPAHATHLTA